MFITRQNRKMYSRALSANRLAWVLVVAALGSLACLTITVTTEVTRSDDAKSRIGMQLGLEADREVYAALIDMDPKAANSNPLADMAKKGWKLTQIENGRIVTASRELTPFENLGAQGWKVQERRLTPSGQTPELRVVTATLDVTQLNSSAAQTGSALKSLEVVLDESDPLTTTYRYQSTIFIEPIKPPSTSSTSSCTGDSWICAIGDSIDASIRRDPKYKRLEDAMKKAGQPRIVMAATMPGTIEKATMNDAPSGAISADGSRVQWALSIDKPGTFVLKATSHPTETLPIIFIPGVGGSSLQSEGRINNFDLWPLAPSGTRDALELLADGATSKTGAKIISPEILQSFPANFYGGMIDFLKSKGYKLGVNLFPFPYDWRLDNRAHFPALDAKIKEALEKSKKSKVILLTHSMGGLIARAYVFDGDARAAKVDSLVTIAAPYWGAPKPYYGLLNGYTFGNPTVNDGVMKTLIQNFPAAYQLMPAIPFVVDTTSNRQLSLEESWKIHYHGLAYIRPSHTPGSPYDVYVPTSDNPLSPNPKLIASTREFYSKVGTKASPRPLPKGVKQYVIIGYGVSTLNEFRIRDPKSGYIWDESYLELGDNKRKIVMEPSFGDGDGTVPLWGLDINGATAKYFVPYNESDTTEHGAMTDNKRAQEIVRQILIGKPPDPSEWSYQRQTEFRTCEQTGNSFSLTCTGIDFTLHSDAHLRITDPRTGRALGFNDKGQIDEALGAGTFLNMDGVEYASIADLGRNYQVTVNGTNEGKFTLTVNLNKGGKKASFVYPEVPVKPGTLAQFQLNPSQVDSKMPDMTVNTDGKVSRVSPRQSGQSAFPDVLALVSDNRLLAMGVGGALLCLMLAGVFAFALVVRPRARRSTTPPLSSPSDSRPSGLPERGQPPAEQSARGAMPRDLPERGTRSRPEDLPE